MADSADSSGESAHGAACSSWLSSHPRQNKTKRLMDVGIAAMLLLVLLPLLLLVAVVIRLESKGPALFRQRRGGVLGRPFILYKFRTMRVTEDGEALEQAVRNDRRVTKFGAVLRRVSIDELPQLLNVLKGDMSLVGPRPHAVAHDREFQTRLPDYVKRFTALPGITGLAQIRGFRGETVAPESLRGRLDCDLEYISNWSIGADVKVLIATLKVPLDSRAY